MNSFEILDMPQDASFEELKAKYEELKAIYGEQRFLPGEQGAEAANKLTELEQAWSEILAQKQIKDDEEKYGVGYAYVERMVKEKKYDEAQERLDAINNRDGEWHYYQALVYYKREWMNDCYNHLLEAVRLSPDNEKFKDSLAKMKHVLGNAQTPPENLRQSVNPNQRPNATGDCLNTCCTTLCCMECMSMCCRC